MLVGGGGVKGAYCSNAFICSVHLSYRVMRMPGGGGGTKYGRVVGTLPLLPGLSVCEGGRHPTPASWPICM
jgi:hypothetical protein